MIGSNKSSVFGVISDPKSYLNIIYLLLGLPLGIAYFVFLVAGISLGFGLAVVWVGIPILGLVLFGSWALCEFERKLTKTLLGEDISEDIPKDILMKGNLEDCQTLEDIFPDLGSGERRLIGGWRRLKSHLSERQTWTGIFYLLLRFPMGIIGFVAAVVLISVTGSLLGAPAYYWVDDGIELGIWQVDVLWEALILSAAGISAAFLSLHLMNAAASYSGKTARVMLGR